MIPLEQIKVASPCPASWDEMQGTDRVRFCAHCHLNVYNLSQMTRAEAEALVARTEGRLCVRFRARADGTVLTRDCPVGLRAVRQRIVRRLSTAAALLLAWGAAPLRGADAAPSPPARPAKPAVPAKPAAPVKPPPHRELLGRVAYPYRTTMGVPEPMPVTKTPPKRPASPGH